MSIKARLDRLAARLPRPHTTEDDKRDFDDLVGYCVNVGRTHWREVTADWEEHDLVEQIEREAELKGLEDAPDHRIEKG
jgi:hypothetical protein